MSENESKPLVWLKGEVKTPPFSSQARLEAGFLLRKLQGVKPCYFRAWDMMEYLDVCSEVNHESKIN